jgi:peptide/nickel transport system substrate-binding protein
MEHLRPWNRGHRTRRPRLAVGLAAGLAAGLLTACGSGGGGVGGSVSELPSDLRIITTAGPATFDQWRTVAQPLGILLMVNEPLVRYDGEQFHGAVAESFETVSPTRYTYTLRDGVTFSDGTPLTPEDVKFTLEESMDDTHYSSTYVVMKAIKTITIDGNTVTVDLKAPEPQFQYVVAQTGVVSKAFYEEHGDSVGTPETGQLGTGPYTLASFSPEQEMVVERNPDYWGDAAPFDTITFAVTKDESARMLALQSGEADGLFEMPINQVEPVEALNGYSVHEVPDSTLYIVQLDTSKPPFDDPKVREAVRHAIDRQAVVDAAFAGKGVVAPTLTSRVALELVSEPGVVDETLAGFDEDNAHDLALAKSAMAESNSPNGFEVTVPIESYDPNMSLIGQTIEQDLGKIGITVDLQVRGEDYIDVLLKREHEGLTINSFSTNTPDAAMPLGYFIPEDGVFNQTGLDDSAATDALTQSNKLAVDDPERGSLILEALTLRQESGTVLPLAMPNMYFALRDGLQPEGFTNYWWMARWDEDVTLS